MQLVILFVAPSGRSDGKFGKVDICFRIFFYGVSSCERCDDIHPINCLMVQMVQPSYKHWRFKRVN